MKRLRPSLRSLLGTWCLFPILAAWATTPASVSVLLCTTRWKGWDPLPRASPYALLHQTPRMDSVLEYLDIILCSTSFSLSVAAVLSKIFLQSPKERDFVIFFPGSSCLFVGEAGYSPVFFHALYTPRTTWDHLEMSFYLPALLVSLR